MLEVLDPAQNSTFRDHYLDLPFDLSEVLFIATANVLDTVPGPLQDRMEVIELAGYTIDEKLHIAKNYLVGRQLAANGLKASQLEFADPALTAIIEEYTREAGVRNLERQIGTVARKIAREVAEGKVDGKVKISAKRARELLGKQRFFSETRRRTKVPGVATGLAWTPVGGEVLFVEASAVPGKGNLTITGQLGDVMRESAQAALTYVRGHSHELAPKLEDDWFATHDIHVHVPAGAVPKDGPSAGCAMATALALPANLLGGVTQRLGGFAQIALNLLVVHQRIGRALAVRHPPVGVTGRLKRGLDVVAQLLVLDQPLHVRVGAQRLRRLRCPRASG